MALMMLVFSLSCLSIAAFICAVLSGYPVDSPGSFAILPFAIMTIVYILCGFGVLLMIVGALYSARVLGFGITATSRSCWILFGIAAVVLSAIHESVRVQVYLSHGKYRDWLLFISLALLLLHEPLSSCLNLKRRLKIDRSARRLVWLSTAFTAWIPLTAAVLAVVHLNALSVAQQGDSSVLPLSIDAWYATLYPATGLYVDLMIGLFGNSPRSEEAR